MQMLLEISVCRALQAYLFAKAAALKFTPEIPAGTTGPGLYRLKSCLLNSILNVVTFRRPITKQPLMIILTTSAPGLLCPTASSVFAKCWKRLTGTVQKVLHKCTAITNQKKQKSLRRCLLRLSKPQRTGMKPGRKL